MGETYDLSTLQQIFKKVNTDKKKAALSPLLFIFQINKQVGFDQILLNRGFQLYDKKSQLQKNKAFKNYQAFFHHMLSQLDSIEQNYLGQSNDQELIEKASIQNKNEYNFLLNKNNISKFIRDQAQHYQKVLDEYLQETENQQKGIKSTKMHFFFIKLFKNKYVNIIKNNAFLMESSNQQLSIYVGNYLLQYSESVKDMSSSQAFAQFTINQEEILDFLTFWLKKEAENGLFVLYARTKQRLEHESRILINKSVAKAEMHPSRMTKLQIIEIQKAQKEDKVNQQVQNNIEPGEQSKKQQPEQPYNISTKVSIKKLNTIDLSKSQVQGHTELAKTQSPTKQANKYQMLQKQLKGLFEFGCKRRYKVNKNTTFQQIQNQRKTMDLQKFINFCNFFQITSINRQLLVQYFKAHAVNMRTIDFTRFEQIIKKMLKNDLKVADNFLNRAKYQNKSRLSQIRRNKKMESELSSYQFKLLPVSGRDVTTIEKELYYRKLQKQIEKEEKDQRALIKRQQLQNPKLGTLKNKSILSHQRISTIDLESIRDSTFNPEKLLHQGPNDQLWNVYEAKIWKKDQKPEKSTLQLLLSKRMNRGAEIIKKINSERSFLTE